MNMQAMEIKGQVVKGKGKGHGLGFATANLPLPEGWEIPYGVYAARVECEGVWYQAVVDVGSQPTLPGDTPMLEAHLLDAAPNLYGKMLTVRLETYLRPELKFESVEALKAQVARDIAAVRAQAEGGA
jgi:riboflavin kinase/FMN adenylyltransferase